MRSFGQWRSIALSLSIGGMFATSGFAVQRLVEFRDGSMISLDLPAIELQLKPSEKRDGATTRSIVLAETEEIAISEVPALERVRRIGESLRLLRNDEFVTRERAGRTLSKLGGGFRSLLQRQLDAALDPEIRWRLSRVLGNLPRSNADDFDHVRLGDSSLSGELVEWKIEIEYRDSVLLLNRSTVRSIRKSAVRGSVAGSDLVTYNAFDPAVLPAGATTLDFERDPGGRALQFGDDIGRRFVDWGLLLSTSVSESFVSVNRFNIAGAGGGFTCATHDPLFEGVITFKFCTPGNQAVPAGVHFVGCWVGAVEKDGTALVAFDAAGNELGRAVTKGGPGEYLAVRSHRPIARVEVQPNPDLDANFTLDDLIFSPPTPLDSSPHPQHYAMLLRDGARLHCRSFTASEDGREYVIEPGAGYAKKIVVPLADISSLLSPATELQPPPPDEELWALLRDGSKLLVGRKGKEDCLLAVGALPGLRLSALWNGKVSLRIPSEALKIPEGGAAVLLRNDPIYLKEVEVRVTELAGVRDDASTMLFNYDRIPTVWFSAPPEPATEKAGIVELFSGERLVFGDGAHFTLKSLDSSEKGVRLEAPAEKAIPLTFERIRSIRFPDLP
jgi:hypothetical protein